MAGFEPARARWLLTLSTLAVYLFHHIRQIWVPTVGVAVLAFLISRDLVSDRTPQTIMEGDVPIVSPDPATPESSPGSAVSRPDKRESDAENPVTREAINEFSVLVLAVSIWGHCLYRTNPSM